MEAIFRKVLHNGVVIISRLPLNYYLSEGNVQFYKESACNSGDLGSIPGLGRSPGKGNGYPL